MWLAIDASESDDKTQAGQEPLAKSSTRLGKKDEGMTLSQ
jgi:hypothetical protein